MDSDVRRPPLFLRVEVRDRRVREDERWDRVALRQTDGGSCSREGQDERWESGQSESDHCAIRAVSAGAGARGSGPFPSRPYIHHRMRAVVSSQYRRKHRRRWAAHAHLRRCDVMESPDGSQDLRPANGTCTGYASGHHQRHSGAHATGQNGGHIG